MTTVKNPLAIIILAGGHGSRLGIDKALLLWRGKPLVQHLIQRFSQANCFVLLAGGSSEWAKRLKGTEVLVVPDFPAHANFGPLAGIEAGFLAIPDHIVGVVACDLPNASPQLLIFLADILQAEKVQAVVPVIDETPQPLHAVYARSCLPTIVEQLETDSKSVKAFLQRIQVKWVDESKWSDIIEPSLLKVNLNEMSDIPAESYKSTPSTLGNLPLPVFAFIGPSGAGKTTILEKVIKELVRRGYQVGTLKHHGHADQVGKDTWRHKNVGATITGLVASDGMAIFMPPVNSLDCAIKNLLRHQNLDVVLSEGFKTTSVPKILVLPPDATSAEQFIGAVDHESIVAAVTNPSSPPKFLAQIGLTKVKTFTQEDTMGLADFIEDSIKSFCGVNSLI